MKTKFFFTAIIFILFNISLNLAQDTSNTNSLGIFLKETGEKILGSEHIEYYDYSNHKITLNNAGKNKWESYVAYQDTANKLRPTVFSNLYKKEFIFKINNDIIYSGIFSSIASSSLYSGIVIYDILGINAVVGADIHIKKHAYVSKDSIPKLDARLDKRIYDFLLEHKLLKQ
jgi:hypothetical protein